MRSIIAYLPLAALATTSFAQFLPSCQWNDCMNAWDGSSCDQASGLSCVCTNATAIAQINTCVATSCTNATDQEAIYGAIAQLCADNGVTVTNSQQATFSATSGGSLLATVTSGGWGPGGHFGSSAWSSWISDCSTAFGDHPTGWRSGDNWGHGWNTGRPGWGSNGGPWATKATGILCSGTASWTTWTAGWGPFSSWTGTWSGCSTTTASPSPATVTTTVTSNGQTSVITGTTFGIQAAAVSVSSSGNAASSLSGPVSPSNSKVLGLCGSVAAGVFALMIAL